jgi:cytochrome o ubiquinol oxidase subunit 2
VAKVKKVNKKLKWALWVAALLVVAGFLVIYLKNVDLAVLQPKGIVALREKRLMVTTVILAMLVIIPVYIMTALIALRYREGNHKARYSPNLSGHWLAETVWWGIPATIILVLSVIAWNSSHDLDPHKALASSVKPLNVQVVALDWKWLFIYPDQGVASVNELDFPAGTPVSFEITADAPMNSFWIPQLGSQIYAMPGMATRLNLMADRPGIYRGSSANLSGSGFAGMDFQAKAGTPADFKSWLETARGSSAPLSLSAYKQLAKPSTQNPVVYYSSVQQGLFDKIVNKYMTPEGQF